MFLLCLFVTLIVVVIGGYRITHPKQNDGAASISTSPQVTTPSESIGTTTIPHSTQTLLGTAHYSDSVGDHVTLSLTSHPLVRSGAVPSGVLSSCGENWGDPNSTLYREVSATVTVTSDLTASVSFTINRMNTPEGSITNPIRTSDLTVVLALTDGPECQDPYNFSDNGVLWKSITPGQSGSLTMWLSYPDVLSPDYPHGNPVDLRDQSWLLPSSIKINGNASGSPTINGPAIRSCTSSRRYFFTPSGASLPDGSC